MAVYKVPQDVEAEDKFLGPLTFKQFLFSGGAAISGYVMFLVITSGLAWLSIIFLPFFLGFTAMAFPWSKDQSTDVFLASRIRFLLVPRRRIWDQTGVKDLVQITVPKREVHIYTDGLDQEQVRNRLGALSSMVDSRGWAVKNMAHAPSSDRLVVAPKPQQSVEQIDAQRAEDILDNQSQQFSTIDNAIKHSEEEHKQHTLALVAEAREKSKQMNKSVLNETDNETVAALPKAKAEKMIDPVLESVSLPKVDPSLSAMKSRPVTPPVTPKISKDDEEALLNKLHKKQETEASIESHSHLKTIQPLGASSSATSNASQTSTDDSASASSAAPVDPAILSLAQNDDRSVDSLAREANKPSELSDDEVVVSLR